MNIFNKRVTANKPLIRNKTNVLLLCKGSAFAVVAARRYRQLIKTNRDEKTYSFNYGNFDTFVNGAEIGLLSIS